ncbi:MAG: single-stranded DNA-binding protein [bacterium]
MNNCIFSGRLTKDCEIVTTTSGVNILKFTLAVNEKNYKTGESKTEFIDCLRFMDDPSNVAQYLTKGKALNVSAKFQTNRWTDKDGNNRISPEFKVVQMEFHMNDPKNQHLQRQQQQTSQQSISQSSYPGAFPSETVMDDAPF